MSIQKRIYDRSPILIQNVLTTIKGYQLKKQRYNRLYYKYLNYFKSIVDVFVEEQKQINKLLIHLKYNIPYYKKHLDGIPDEQLNEEVLVNLPIISKEVLRRDISKLVNINHGEIFKVTTGGTTGKSLNVYFDREDFAKRMAYLDYFKQSHGIKPFSKRASFTGKEIIPYRQKSNVYWRYNSAINQMLYSGFQVSEKNIPYYIKSLNKFKPEAIDGFPTSIYRIAKYINLNRIKLDFKPVCIFPTAETLLDKYREEIERAFNCPVRNQYASSEGAPFITECREGRLHLNIETGFFNFKSFNKEENLYELLVTSFLNYTTPIVQYKIGDIVEYNKVQQPCECGNKSDYVEKILGRQSDYLVSKVNGRITSANMSNVYKDAPNSIIACQFVQEKMDEVIVNAVIDNDIFKDTDKENIINSLKYRFGETVSVKFNLVEEIPKERSGKTLFLKNLLDENGF